MRRLLDADCLFLPFVNEVWVVSFPTSGEVRILFKELQNPPIKL